MGTSKEVDFYSGGTFPSSKRQLHFFKLLFRFLRGFQVPGRAVNLSMDHGVSATSGVSVIESLLCCSSIPAFEHFEGVIGLVVRQRHIHTVHPSDQFLDVLGAFPDFGFRSRVPLRDGEVDRQDVTLAG